MIRAIVHGAGGKMGRVLATLVEDVVIVAGVDTRAREITAAFPLYDTLFGVSEEADVVIDFSRPAALPDLLRFAKQRGISLVLATTGYTPEDMYQIQLASQTMTIFQSSNFAIGLSVLADLVTRAASALRGCDVEIVEAHHRMKADAPSGTALSLSAAVRQGADRAYQNVFGRSPQSPPRSDQEIGMHSLRGGTVAGEHSVFFYLDDEFIEIRHSAQSRDIFARGALCAAQFIVDRGPGLYGMRDLFA